LPGVILQFNLILAKKPNQSRNTKGLSPFGDITVDHSKPEHLDGQYDPKRVNLTQCFEIFREGGFDGEGTVYRNGTLIPKGGNTTEAAGITYSACIKNCGGGQPVTTWFDFSQDISAWLLPWLALISQLPFGANNRTQNISALFLYIGSPALSAYSLVLTLLNRHYVSARFSTFKYPNAYHAARILADLQQVPVDVNTSESLLASLVVLPENDKWFRSVRRSLKCEHGWSAAAFTSIAWVVISYALTVSNAFIDVAHVIEQGSSGQTVGLMWLWVSISLSVAAKCSHGHLAHSSYFPSLLAGYSYPQDAMQLSLRQHSIQPMRMCGSPWTPKGRLQIQITVHPLNCILAPVMLSNSKIRLLGSPLTNSVVYQYTISPESFLGPRP
jgi:hypothetical protein